MNDQYPKPECTRSSETCVALDQTLNEEATRASQLQAHRSAVLRIMLSCLAVLLFPLLTGCDAFRSLTPAEAIQLMNNPSRADARRAGIAALTTRWDFGKKPPYPNIYQGIAQHDSDVTVRAMAIRALNICRDSTATKIFIAGLTDDSEQIRLESAKALANVPDPDAIPRLLQILNGTRLLIDPGGQRAEIAESKDVRIASADALRQYHGKVDVTRTLVEFLNASDFSVAWQCRQSLIALTGQDLQYDEGAWLKYLVGQGKPVG